MKVGVVGYSERVSELAQLCKKTKTELHFWEPEDEPRASLPKGVKRVGLEQLSECALIFFCTPASRARMVARVLGEYITGHHVIVHLSRELEPDSNNLLSQVLRQETATHRIGFLTGPFRADDIKAGRSASATLFSRFPEVHGLLQETLVSPTFRVYRSTDLVGAQLAAAYSRVIAFVYGVGLGMKQGTGVGSTLFARGLAEIGRVVAASEGEERTVFGMSGAGNLFADVQEPFSMEVRLGQECVALGSYDVETLSKTFGDTPERFAELVRTVNETCTARRVSSNICEAALAMVENRLDTISAATHLMTLPVLDE